MKRTGVLSIRRFCKSKINLPLHWSTDSVAEVCVLLEHDATSEGNQCWRY